MDFITVFTITYCLILNSEGSAEKRNVLSYENMPSTKSYTPLNFHQIFNSMKEKKIVGLKEPEGIMFDFGHSQGYGGSHGKRGLDNFHYNKYGCEKPGQIVCDVGAHGDLNRQCQYAVCVYSSEMPNLWWKPDFTVVRMVCPDDIGVPAEFAALCASGVNLSGVFQALHKGKGGHGSHGNGHGYHKKKRDFKDTTPCVVSNTLCDGDLDHNGRNQFTTTTTIAPTIAPTVAPDIPGEPIVANMIPPATGLRQLPLKLQRVRNNNLLTSPARLSNFVTESISEQRIPDAGCPGQFLKFPRSHSLGGVLAPVDINTQEGCKRFCLGQSQCRAVDFSDQVCYYFDASRQVKTELDPRSNHFIKTSCNGHAGADSSYDSCFPGYKVNGAARFKTNTPTITSCQQMCNQDDSCYGVDFDLDKEKCWFHTSHSTCGTLIPLASSTHCRKKDCGVTKPGHPSGFSLVSVGYQQKGGEHISGSNSRSACIQTCSDSPQCAAVDYKIDNGTCWHIPEEHACGALIRFDAVTNYRKQTTHCN